MQHSDVSVSKAGSEDPGASSVTALDDAFAAKDETRNYRLFMLSVAATLTLCISGVFIGIAVKNRSLIESEMLTRARADFENLALMRKWNADYGGVFVEKRPGMVSNPHLPNPDITDRTGKVYTKKNPALMTRELSDMQMRGGYAHHMTSLRPLNPGNRADPAETAALEAFEKGEKERSWFEVRDGKRFFCYMAPLQVENSCLECHAVQGYRTGQVRGGISIRFDVEDVHRKVQRNFTAVIVLAVLNIAVLIAVIYLFFRKLVGRLKNAREQLVKMAATDSLTGLSNRRVLIDILEREMKRHLRTGGDLSCFILDLDRFKFINDSFGHLTGDFVLKETARVLKASLRAYDSVGRYGGEEFVAVLPQSGQESAVGVAERVRNSLEQTVRVGAEGGSLNVTGSFGVAVWLPGESSGRFLRRADEALYRAKSEGRNRVVVAESGPNRCSAAGTDGHPDPILPSIA